jgi:hypothetical protein
VFSHADNVEQHDLGLEAAGESLYVSRSAEASIGEVNREENLFDQWHRIFHSLTLHPEGQLLGRINLAQFPFGPAPSRIPEQLPFG